MPESVRRVSELLRSLGHRQDLAELAGGGSSRLVGERLGEWRGSGEQLVLYWTGHGSVDAGRHFLVTADSPADGMSYVNAVPTEQLARLLAHTDFAQVLFLVDCCASGVAAAQIATAVSEVVSHTSTSFPDRRFSVIASACGYESAEEGVFAEALEGLLRRGPDDRRWTEHDEVIRSDDLARALGRELGARDGATSYQAVGAPVPTLRNPLHPGVRVPDEDVETKQRRRLRADDVDQHLVLSARGIEVGETGWYFCGREHLLGRVLGWLADAERGLFAVTGSPGTGKSALLGRIATLSVPALREIAEHEGALADTRTALLPALGSVDVALVCRHKTLPDVLLAVTEALQLPLPHDASRLRPVDVVHAVSGLGRRVALVVDGLDEAGASEAMLIAADLLRPLADLPGVRVLVGTRPEPAGRIPADDRSEQLGGLLHPLAPDRTAVLDHEPQTEQDLTAYALRRLLGADRSRPALDEATARRWARTIARASAGVFLYARLATRAVSSGTVPPTDGTDGRGRPHVGVEELLDHEFDRLPDPRRVRDLLRPLAWAEGAGLPRRDIWPQVATALAAEGRTYHDEDISWLLQHVGFHLVESGESGQTVYRLHHQSLTDYFRRRSPEDAQSLITRALSATVATGSPDSWAEANPYLHQHLAAHARAAGLLPSLAQDQGFLVHTDPTRTAAALTGLPDRFELPVARLYLRVAHRLHGLAPEERLRLLQMTAMVNEPELLPLLNGRTAVPVTVVAGSAPPRDFSVNLRGHVGPVTALVRVPLRNGRELLASAGGDGRVRLWDSVTCETVLVLAGAGATVTALACLDDGRGGRLLAAAAGAAVHVWSVPDGTPVAVLRGHTGRVLCLAAEDAGPAGPALLASAGKDRRIRLWDPYGRQPCRVLPPEHLGFVTALAFCRSAGGRPLLLSGGADCTVRVWDVGSDRPVARLHGHSAPVGALTGIGALRGRRHAASGSEDGVVRVWDLDALRPAAEWHGRVGAVRSLTPLTGEDGTPELAVAGTEPRIVLVDPLRGVQRRLFDSRVDPEVSVGAPLHLPGGTHALEAVDLEAATGRIDCTYTLAPVASADRTPLIASGGWEGMLRLWHPALAGPPQQEGEDDRRSSRLSAVRTERGWQLALDWSGALHLLELDSGRTRTVHEVSDRLRALTTLTTPNGLPLVLALDGDRVSCHDARPGRSLPPDLQAFFDERGRTDSAEHVATYADGRRVAVLVVCYTERTDVLVWERDRERLFSLAPLPGAPTAGVDADGTVLLACPDNEEGLRVVPLLREEPGSAERTAQGGREAPEGFPLPLVSALPPLWATLSDGRYALVTAAEDGITVTGVGEWQPVLLPDSLGPFDHWATMRVRDHDLVVTTSSDGNLRVWNPSVPDRPPLAVPLPGRATGLGTGAPDLVFLLLGDRWLGLRLTGPALADFARVP
ncbi:hypothetical protein ACFV6F_23230 [Kitasatospora phosalacinea]|uniref:hypothetical protein n=1 Tax=Kitasatospora phosalacinea TaxID=2065 RepID=UPI003651B497